MSLTESDMALLAALTCEPRIVANEAAAKACRRLRIAGMLDRCQDYVLTDEAGVAFIRSSYLINEAGREALQKAGRL